MRIRSIDPRQIRVAMFATVIATTGVLTACSAESSAPSATTETVSILPAASAHGSHAGNGSLSPDQLRAIGSVRNATTRFHDLAAARTAGYTLQYPAGCAESSQGGQGFHYLNEALVDDKVELLKPELVMYEPGPNGQMQLVGVDYVVPLAASAEPPTLLGVPFMRNDGLGVWALHIWAWRPNPSGMFAAWNPKVSCRHAARATP
jgi:hypothetical protein